MSTDPKTTEPPPEPIGVSVADMSPQMVENLQPRQDLFAEVDARAIAREGSIISAGAGKQSREVMIRDLGIGCFASPEAAVAPGISLGDLLGIVARMIDFGLFAVESNVARDGGYGQNHDRLAAAKLQDRADLMRYTLGNLLLPDDIGQKIEAVVTAALAEHATGCKACGHPHVQHALHEVRRLAGLLRPAEHGALLPGFDQPGPRVQRRTAPHVDAGPEPADGVRIMVRLGWTQTPAEDFEALFSVATAAAQQAANLRLHDAGDTTVYVVLPAEVYDLGMQATSRATGDDRVIPLLDAMRGGYPMVEVRREREPESDAKYAARMLRENMARNLASWSEDGGHLLRTEPDVEERALIRIRLRATIAACDLILGEKHDDQADADADHRDRMRIADSAREQDIGTDGVDGGKQIVTIGDSRFALPFSLAAEFLDADDGEDRLIVLLKYIAEGK